MLNAEWDRAHVPSSLISLAVNFKVSEKPPANEVSREDAEVPHEMALTDGRIGLWQMNVKDASICSE
jgi:hypothetical protein